MTSFARWSACVALTAVSAGLLPSIVVAQTRPEYSLREDQPRTGTNILRHQFRGSSVPVNLPYEELSAQDQARFKQNYEPMAAGDEPPFPKGGLRAILRPIAQIQHKLHDRGDVLLVAKVSPEGHAVSVSAYGSADKELLDAASRVVMLTDFKPAVCGGVPCEMEFPLRFTAKVEHY